MYRCDLCLRAVGCTCVCWLQLDLWRKHGHYVKISVAEKINKIQNSAKERIKIEEADLAEARKGSEFILYDKFFDRTPPFELVKSTMPKIWKVKANVSIINLSIGFFVFKFENKEDYWEVYAGGLWFLRGQTLFLIQWKNNFQHSIEKIDAIPVWVQLPGLPLEFLNSRILPQVAAAIGKPLRFDNVTQKGERGKFTCIYVMMNLKEPVQ
ncbi:hypothetical protein Cni_G17299 [Canna indica]|uniref:DUF4283 domain-containing protein n=1 Tax=Canna indica TaxID=4628 RepID=A0AAQ3KME8_9LILI|nr:hypothetical protein Cni_G17299 [Canna indica]